MKAIIYTRVSSTNDRQNAERQISDLTLYAKSNKMDICCMFNEKISGAKTNTLRTELNVAFHYAKSNGIEINLFSELSRLGRNTLEVLECVKFLQDNGINAYFQKENFSILGSDGKVSPITTIYLSCLCMCAEFERENIKFRLNSGRELAIKKGVKMGRKIGSKETSIHKENKYPISLKYIRKGYKLVEVLAIANDKGEKVSMATLKRLKSEYK